MSTLSGLWALWQQFFPPAPAFTERDVGPGSKVSKIFIITGANSGIGLFRRSSAKLQGAIAEVNSTLPSPAMPSNLKSMLLDLSDLETIKPAAALFAAQETRLDIPITKQGIEAHVGANCVAPLLFTQELLPMLRTATLAVAHGSVRIIWSSSTQIDMCAPQHGIGFSRIEKPTTVTYEDYGASKGRHSIFMLYEPKFGAYTMLYSGLSPDVGEDSNGAYIWPWGRIQPIARLDILKVASEGKATAL
ncbi:NAD(P)-binding protein [Daldinia grandis]|nr:NAD(P)-binding protein [Daldinia grandis]